MTWSIKVYFSSGTVDLCAYSGISLVDEKSIRVQDGGFDSEFKMVRGTASFNVAQNSDLLAKLIAQTARPVVEVFQAGVQVHTGLLRPAEELSFSNSLDFWSLSSVDRGDDLDQRIGVDISTSGVVCRSAGGADSLLHLIASKVSPALTVICDNCLTSVPYFSAEADETVSDVLNVFLPEHSVAFRLDELGRLVARNIPSATPIITVGSGAGDVAVDDGSLKMKRSDVVEDSVEVEYLGVASIPQAIRFSGETSLTVEEQSQKTYTLEWDALPAGATLVGHSGFRIFVKGEWTYNSEYDPGYNTSTKERQVYPVSEDVAGTVLTVVPEISKAGAVLAISVNTRKVKIQRIKITSDYTYAIASKKATSSGTRKVFKTVKAKYLFSETAAATYAERLRSRLGGGGWKYSFTSPTKIAIGTVATINGAVDGISAIALLTGRSYSRSNLRYQYEAVRHGDITVTPIVSQQKSLSSPSTVEILTSDSYVVRKPSGLTVPASILFSAVSANGATKVPFFGTFRVYETADWGTWSLVSTSAASVSSLAFSPSLGSVGVMAEIWSDAGAILDNTSVSVLIEGASQAYVESLENSIPNLVRTYGLKYLGPKLSDPTESEVLGYTYLHTTDLTVGAGDSELREYDGADWVRIDNPTSDQISAAFSDIAEQATFYKGAVTVVNQVGFFKQIFTRLLQAQDVEITGKLTSGYGYFGPLFAGVLAQNTPGALSLPYSTINAVAYAAISAKWTLVTGQWYAVKGTYQGEPMGVITRVDSTRLRLYTQDGVSYFTELSSLNTNFAINSDLVIERVSSGLVLSDDLAFLVNAAFSIGSSSKRAKKIWSADGDFQTLFGTTGTFTTLLPAILKIGGNILPTNGGIYSSGSNANGYYQRFTDMTQICYMNFGDEAAQVRTFPASFADATYALVLTKSHADSGNTAGATWASKTPTTVYIDPAYGSDNKGSCSYIAFGRWSL